MAVLRRAVMTWGMAPERTCARSSSKVTSRTQWVRFSMRQWARRMRKSAGVGGRHPLRGAAGHAIDLLVALFARLLDDDVALDDEGLARAGRVAVARQHGARRHPPPLAAPMAQVDRLGRRERRPQVRRGRQDRRSVVAQARLVLLGHHHIVPPAREDGRGHGARGQQRIHREHAAL